MPNWKKLILSGSDAELNSLNVTSALTASGLNYPSTDGTDGQVIMTDGSGVLTFNDVSVYAQVKNATGGTLAKGTPVHASGSIGNTSEVIAASASVAETMPATFILAEELADEAEGRAIVVGYINGVNTSTFNEGDVVYVGAEGGYTNVKPTGSNLIQNLGIVTKVDASNGSGFIYGSGRSNDVPNITSGYAWVGNSDSVATAVATSSFSVASATDATNATNVNVGNSDDSSTYYILGALGTGNQALKRDSGITFNSSTNTLNVGNLDSADDITTEGSLITTKTGSVTDPALLIGVNSGYLAGNNTGIILEEAAPGTTFFVPYFVSNGAKIFGFGTIMLMETNLDMQSNKIYFDGDSTNTYIASNVDDPEDLEIHADQDILLSSDRYLIISGSRPGSAFVGMQLTGNITASGAISASGDLTVNEIKPTKIELEKSSTTDGDANGDVVYFGGTTSMITGRIYHYKSDGTWELANPNATATSDGLLGVALGASSDTNGVLLRGMVTLDHDPGAVGDVLYLNEQQVVTKYGAATSIAPSGTGDVVRIIGYCLDATNGQIYFNPSPDFIVHA